MTSKRKRLPKEIKDRLLVDAMHRCCLCPQHEDVTDIHHIVPISEDGPNTEDNLMVVCPTCHAKIHRIRGRYTPEQLRMYKERWVSLCAKGLTLEERLAEEPGINLFIKPILQRGKSGKQGKAYPYLKALLDGLIEAAPNWMKAPAKFVSSLSEQLKDKGKEENKQLEKEIQGISEDELRAIIGEAGWEQREDIEFIVGRVKLIPEILKTIDYRFDKVDETHEEIIKLLKKLLPQELIIQNGGVGFGHVDNVTIIQKPSAEKSSGKEEVESKLRVFTSKLPVTGSKLFGREQQLVQLDEAWANEHCHILSFVAWGGVGKSALVNEWLGGMERKSWDGARRVYGWSFYSQGTREDRQASGDAFLAHALEWFGDKETAESSKSAWDKGVRLAELIRQEKTLLILDGLEPLQYPPGPMQGRLKDQGLQALLRELCHGMEGLCVISTREKIEDLETHLDHAVKREFLETLTPEAGMKVLRNEGVKGTDKELKDVSEEFGGHALALTLLGNYLSVVHDGEIRKRDLMPVLTEDEEKGGHARRVMQFYEDWLKETAELDILYLMGLFDRPAELVRELIGGDERFFEPDVESNLQTTEEGIESGYNYNKNLPLVQAIEKGARGAYWDILRQLRKGE